MIRDSGLLFWATLYTFFTILALKKIMLVVSAALLFGFTAP